MISFKEHAAEWCRVPKNTTNVKNKIIEVLLQLRKPDDNGKLVIDQDRFLSIVYQQWGGPKAPANMTDSDKLRIFALIMSRAENFYILRQLSEGLLIRTHQFFCIIYQPNNIFLPNHCFKYK